MMQEMGDGGVRENFSLGGCHKLFRNFGIFFISLSRISCNPASG